jgi:hypothetical protein
MASLPETTGNNRLYSREDANRWIGGPSGPLAREMRAKGITAEKLERLSGVPERRIEMLRSQNEETPVYLEDVIAIASVLGPRFLTGILSEVDMYAAEFNGASPEKIGAEIIQLARKLTGGTE